MSPWRLVGRVCAVLLIALYVAMLPALLLAYDVQAALMDGRFLEQGVADIRVFDGMLTATAEGLAREMPQDDAVRGTPLAHLDEQDWEQVLRVMAPPASLQRWTQDGVAEFRRWLRDGGRSMEEVTLPFGEMSANLVDDPQHTALQVILDAQPACTANEESLAGPDDLVPRCRPDNPDVRGTLVGLLARRWSDRPRDVWQQLWPGEVGRHPDTLTLGAYAAASDSTGLADMRNGLAGTHAVLVFSRWLALGLAIAVSCLLMGLVALLAARNIAEAVRWAGAPLALAGVATVALALTVRVVQAVGSFTYSAGLVMSRFQADVIANAFARPFAADLWPLLATHGGILAAVGAALWVSSFLIPVRRPVPVTVPEVLR
jgi:hypothetical protein